MKQFMQLLYNDKKHYEEFIENQIALCLSIFLSSSRKFCISFVTSFIDSVNELIEFKILLKIFDLLIVLYSICRQIYNFYIIHYKIHNEFLFSLRKVSI
jgi:hypothetical protein